MRYLATRFSAKEAFSKAIGLGMRMPMTWRGCEIVNRSSGKPEIRLNGVLADWFESRGLSAHVSVTDEADYAASFVVVERKRIMNDSHSPVILDVAGLALDAADRRRLAHPLTGGVVLFARNWRDRMQLTELAAEIKSIRADLLICVDHEGGRVQRFRSDGFTALPPMRMLGEMWMDDAGAGRGAGAMRAMEAAHAAGHVLASRAARLRRRPQLHAGARPRPWRERRHRRSRLPSRPARRHDARAGLMQGLLRGRHAQLRQALPRARLRPRRQPPRDPGRPPARSRASWPTMPGRTNGSPARSPA